METEIGTMMKADWNRRATENARWYIASDVKDDEEFTRSGEPDVEFALRRLDRRWLGNARVLEIGCGAGRMTRYFLRRVWSLCSIDVSSEMISLAAGRLGRHPNLQLLTGNGLDLSMFADGYFDLAVSYVVFQHIPNPIVRGYFREIHRVLLPGGVFRGQVARLDFPGFVQPDDADTFSMRSWEPEEVGAEFREWSRLELEICRCTDTIEHIWITATK
ncbi:hypothetical protein OJF2_55230 [Aquisphaera giovannonii]|uniref:Methyltransferase type 11 domain-containing protein n=1 Tax=Aquisphaera giovannonii TaxID=406548 RepID=A0A5B9W8J7_9BACT|nr:class I SAM-dependent methyltransferase [Aquisphaera giovannonii]QEH36938.1 hypothetical protein OJF2_55230 [Aquisphaera giovannonii]